MLRFFLAFMAISAPLSQASAAPEAEVRSFVKEVISTIKGHSKLKTQFKTTGCAKIPPQKWIQLLLVGEPVRHTFQFAKECDLQGDVVVTQGLFPIDLMVRNIPGVDRVKSKVFSKITPDFFAQKIHVLLSATEGKLYAQKEAEQLSFTADYRLATGLNGQLRDSGGGNVYVTRYHGEQIPRLQEKFRIEAK